jgi:hypothetical protein
VTQPRLSKLDLWQKHSLAVMAILQHALELLVASDVRGFEPEMNRSLTLFMHMAMKVRRTAGEYVPAGLPVWEARNQPTPDTGGGTSEGKIPDIQWGYFDDQIADAMFAARYFHIECKRLGSAALNRKYVTQGIERFVDEEWKYGKDVGDGAMVGYIAGQGLDTVLSRVNRVLVRAGRPPLDHVTDEGALRICRHTLERTFPKSPFDLSHVWAETL